MKEERMIRVTKEQLENISEYFDSDVSIFDQIFEMFSCFDGEVTEYDYRLKRFDGLEPAPPKLDRDEIITLKGCLYYLLNDLESRDEDGYIRPNCIAGNKVLEKMIQWLVTIEGQIVKEE